MTWPLFACWYAMGRTPASGPGLTRTETRSLASDSRGLWSNVLIAALPVDVRVANPSRLRPSWVPYVWGLPSAEQHRLAGAGQVVAPGCIVPEYPARYALFAFVVNHMRPGGAAQQMDAADGVQAGMERLC